MMYIAKISISLFPSGILEARRREHERRRRIGWWKRPRWRGSGGGGGGHAKKGCFLLERTESENIDHFSNADEFLTLDTGRTLKGCVDKIFENGSPG